MINESINDVYQDLCLVLLQEPRLNSGCREIRNAKVTLTDISNNIVEIRNISKEYLMAELIWYFAGRNDTAFIGSFASMWNKISDNGKTNNSAYGYLMKKAYGFDQIEKIIELLKKDPESRRAVINLNAANANVIETKDEPCTISLQFLLRWNKLHCTAVMRSNDIWFGFPYDVAFFTELQKYIADKLEVGYGEYTHFAGSLHLYERDEEKVREVAIKAKREPVFFDRNKLHEHCDEISTKIDIVLAQGGNVKEAFRDLLKFYKIMEV